MTILPPKAVLRRKLHELYAQLAASDDGAPLLPARATPPPRRRKHE